jgi:hypothetical protein
MKTHYRKRKTRYEFELTGKGRTTAHGGQVLVDALCRRFRLWERISRIEGIDPRKRKGSGHDPEAMAAQILFTLTSGGASLADAERLGQDTVLLESVGLEKVADQTTLGEWLRAQTPESVRLLCKLNSDFVKEVLAESKPARVRHGGELEVFFDDTEIEVYGKKIEGARLNYNGDLALSWQTLWAGPFLLDEELGGFGTVSECQQELIDEHGALWAGGKSYFYADSGSSEGKLLTHTAGSGFSRWSVLSDLDLHHPPCLALIANRAFYALATLAYNILTALKVLELDDEQQTWRVRTLIRYLLTVPATLVRHANRRKLRICLPAGMMRWWRLLLMRLVPRRKRGEGTDEVYWPVRNE